MQLLGQIWMQINKQAICGSRQGQSLIYGFKNIHDYRYDVRALTNRGLRSRVIYVRKSPSRDSTLDWKII